MKFSGVVSRTSLRVSLIPTKACVFVRVWLPRYQVCKYIPLSSVIVRDCLFGIIVEGRWDMRFTCGICCVYFLFWFLRDIGLSNVKYYVST